jgi:hypothetical protein
LSTFFDFCCHRCRFARSVCAVVFAVFAAVATPVWFGRGAVAAAPAAPRPSRYDFYGRGPYRTGVPRPPAILGYEAGDTHTTFRDQERVVLAIAEAAPDRVRVFEYGKSGRGPAAAFGGRQQPGKHCATGRHSCRHRQTGRPAQTGKFERSG